MVLVFFLAAFVSALAVADARQLNTSVSTLEGPGVDESEFCISGRLAPKFFLVGAPKSGTTFFYEDFARSKGLVQYEPIDEPEWHSKEPWVFAGSFSTSGIDPWLQHYPRCNDAKNKVAVDCTPGYFGDELAAWNIKVAYPIKLRPYVIFMVFLRKPIARAHSHYYQFLENGVMDGAFSRCQPSDFPATFAKAAIALLESPNHKICDCDCNYIFSNSFYADAFKRFFSHWNPHQFHVVPFNLAIGHEIVQYTWDLLNVPPGWGDKGDLAGGGNAENHHGYPKLESDLDAELLNRLRQFMDEKTGAKVVAELIASTEANLFKFNGARNVDNVADWLSDGWW